MWSFHGSAVVGTYIFGFVLPNLVSVAIFVENRCSYCSLSTNHVRGAMGLILKRDTTNSRYNTPKLPIIQQFNNSRNNIPKLPILQQVNNSPYKTPKLTIIQQINDNL